MIVSFQITLRTKRACNFHTKNGADSNINFNGTGTIEKVDISHIWKEFAFQYLYQLKIMKSYDVYTNTIFQTFRVQLMKNDIEEFLEKEKVIPKNIIGVRPYTPL